MQDDSPGGESWVSLSVWSPQVVQEPMANFLVEQTSRGVELKGNWIKAYCRQGEEARYCLKQLQASLHVRALDTRFNDTYIGRAPSM